MGEKGKDMFLVDGKGKFVANIDNNHIGLDLNNPDYTISADAAFDGGLNFGNQTDHVDCETPDCDNDINIPSQNTIIIICLKAMQEGWYIDDQGNFMCPECKARNNI